MAKIKVTYMGSTRGNTPMPLHEEIMDERDYDTDEHEELAQQATVEYFDVTAWVEVKTVE